MPNQAEMNLGSVLKWIFFVDISFLEIGALIYLLIEENELKVKIL
jgi:hypothetical protein